MVQPTVFPLYSSVGTRTAMAYAACLFKCYLLARCQNLSFQLVKMLNHSMKGSMHSCSGRKIKVRSPGRLDRYSAAHKATNHA